MKTLKYQQDAISELTDKAVKLLNLGGSRRKIVFEAPTGAGKTVMTCQTLANIVDELRVLHSPDPLFERFIFLRLRQITGFAKFIDFFQSFPAP